MNQEQIQALVTDALRNNFPKLRDVRVFARNTEDDDGDDILEITVVFEAKKGDFNPEEVPAFLNKVVPVLMTEKRSPFPIFSFVTKSEWGNRTAAA